MSERVSTVTTAEELDALPLGGIIQDDEGDAWQRFADGWKVAGGDPRNKNSTIYGETPTLPATVWESKP